MKLNNIKFVLIIPPAKGMGPVNDIKGIAFKKEDKIIFTEPNVNHYDINNMVDLPYEYFNMKHFSNAKMMAQDPTTYYPKPVNNMKSINIISGRGCVYKCNFCSRSSSYVNYKNIDTLLTEIDFLKNTYNVNSFHFIDELFIYDISRLKELCKRIKKLNISWDCHGRVNLLNYDLFCMMKDAGCISIGLGIESGSPKILKRMNKQITIKKIEKVLNDAAKADMHIKILLIAGYFGETIKSLLETVDLFKRIKNSGRRFSIYTPLPGSSDYDYLIKNNKILNEDLYLDELCDGYSTTEKLLINITKLSDEKLSESIIFAEEEMKNNYIKYLLENNKSRFFDFLKYGLRLNKKEINKLLINLKIEL